MAAMASASARVLRKRSPGGRHAVPASNLGASTAAAPDTEQLSSVSPTPLGRDLSAVSAARSQGTPRRRALSDASAPWSSSGHLAWAVPARGTETNPMQVIESDSSELTPVEGSDEENHGDDHVVQLKEEPIYVDSSSNPTGRDSPRKFDFSWADEVESDYAIRAAEAELTEYEREQIARREQFLLQNTRKRAHPPVKIEEVIDEHWIGKDPSVYDYKSSSEDDPDPLNKGKTVDPRNWGNITLTAEERDVDAQRQLWKSLVAKGRHAEHDSEPVNDFKKSDSTAENTSPSNENRKGTRRSKKAKKLVKSELSSEPVDEPKKTSPEVDDLKLKLAKARAELAVFERRSTQVEGARKRREHDKSSIQRGAAHERIRDVVKRSSTTPRESSGFEASRPIAQLAPGSYLHNALNSKRASRPRGGHNSPGDDSSSSSSDTSSKKSSLTPSDPSDTSDSASTSSSSDSATNGGGGGEGGSSGSSSSSSSSSKGTAAGSHDSRRGRGSRKRRTRRKSKSGKKKARRRRSRSSSEERLKPIPPPKYDGRPVERDLTIHLQGMMDYLRTGRVKADRQVYIAGRFLTGTAREYYDNFAARNPHKIGITKFYQGLFDYCFPRNYRARQRERLASCKQRDRSVKQYVQELHDLFSLIGGETKRNRVLKLWSGFRMEIQSELYLKELHEEVSSWKDIVRTAEIIEAAIESRSANRKTHETKFTGRAKSHTHNGDKVLNRDKYRNIPRSKRDRSPAPPKQDSGAEPNRNQRGGGREWKKKPNRPTADHKRPEYATKNWRKPDKGNQLSEKEAERL